MFKTILIESSKRMFYGLGFGIGMGTAFKLIPIERKSNKKNKFLNSKNEIWTREELTLNGS